MRAGWEEADHYNGSLGFQVSGFAKGFLVGVGTVAGLWALGGLIAFAMIASGGGSAPVEPESALEVTLSGSVPEYLEFDLPSFFPGEDDHPTTLLSHIRAIRAAADDARIKALVLRCNGSASGWARAQDLRWAVSAFKESGKPVWAFMELAGTEDYYIASLADRIVIQPESFLDLSGLSVEVMFFKGAMDKLGVEADLIRTGRYKSAGEPFSREAMSPEWRQVLNETLDEFYDQLLEGIAEGRSQGAGHWRGILDQGPFRASEALEAGLTDDVLFEDEFWQQLAGAAEVEGEIARTALAAYVDSMRPGEASGRKVFALLHAAGPIYSGTAVPDPFSPASGTLASRSFIRRLNSLREDDGVDGVLLRIDSPGGDAIASEQILRAVRRLAGEKPLVVSMANVAASGGYYIASVPDVPILAYPGTYTGSIGVFSMHLNLRSLYDKLGLKKEILVRGENAAMLSDYRPLSASARDKLRGYVDSIYDTFLKRVSEGRGMETERVAEVAEGRVWVGTQAQDNGLVDSMGGYVDAIERLRQVAGLEEGERVRLVTYPARRSILEAILSSGPGTLAFQQLAPPELRRPLESWSDTAIWAARLHSRPLYLAPFRMAVE